MHIGRTHAERLHTGATRPRPPHRGGRVALAVVPTLAVAATPFLIGAGHAAVPTARPAAVIPGIPRTLYVTTANNRVEVAPLLYPGRYLVQVRTRDALPSRLQVVQPLSATYTKPQFVRDWARYEADLRAGQTAAAQGELDAMNRSVRFLGGSSVAPGGLGAFGDYFSRGAYWFYEDRFDGPTHANRIVTMTVKGGVASVNSFAPPAATLAYRGEALRITAATLPRSGWLMAANVSGGTRGWTLWKLPSSGLSNAAVAACVGAPAPVGPATPTPAVTPTQTPTATATPSVTPTPTATASASVSPTSTATASGAPRAVALVQATVSASPSASPTSTTSSASPSASPTTSASPSTSPSATASPTASPAPSFPCEPQFVSATGRDSVGVGTPFYFSLTAGDYVVADNRSDRAGSSPVVRGLYARFSVAG